MKKQTQLAVVRAKMLQEGEINNKWAIMSGFWRLSDIIYKLRGEGMNIHTGWVMKKGKPTKISLYTLVK